MSSFLNLLLPHWTINYWLVLQDECWDNAAVKEEMKDEVSVEELQVHTDRLVCFESYYVFVFCLLAQWLSMGMYVKSQFHEAASK